MKNKELRSQALPCSEASLCYRVGLDYRVTVGLKVLDLVLACW